MMIVLPKFVFKWLTNDELFGGSIIIFFFEFPLNQIISNETTNMQNNNQ